MQSQIQAVEARESASAMYPQVKMPGIGKVGTITLLEGTVSNDQAFWNFYNQIKMNTVDRTTITISGPDGITWTLQNAWPTRIDSTSVNRNGSEITIRSMELAYESITQSTE